MGKLTWQQLGMIYEGSFGLDPKEAAEILSDHLFNKGWVGNEKTPGRMWQDNETCAAFVWYLKEVEIYRKQNNLSFSKAVERMCSINHPQHKLFIVLAKLTKLKPKRFLNLVSMWKKLPFVKKKPKIYSASYLKQQKQIAANLKKEMELNKKIEILKKKKPSIYAARRK